MSIEDVLTALKDPANAPKVAVEVEVGGDQVEFVFHSIGKEAWANLLRDHPPTKTQIRADLALRPDGDAAQVDHNTDTLPVAAIAQACESHPMTLEQAEQLRARMSADAFDALWVGVRAANVGGNPKLRRVGSTPLVSDESDASPTTSEPPEAFSSDE